MGRRGKQRSFHITNLVGGNRDPQFVSCTPVLGGGNFSIVGQTCRYHVEKFCRGLKTVWLEQYTPPNSKASIQSLSGSHLSRAQSTSWILFSSFASEISKPLYYMQAAAFPQHFGPFHDNFKTQPRAKISKT
jgi:hypothetical protein